MLAATLVIAATLLWLHYRGGRRWALPLSVLLGVLATLCKENALVVFPLLVALDRLLYRDQPALAVAWQAVGNSLFGYAAWAWLLARHPAATVTPMALLVPLFGMGGAALWLNEGLPAWKLSAAALVISGLALNLLWPQLRNRLRPTG